MYPKIAWCVASLVLVLVLFPEGAFSNVQDVSYEIGLEAKNGDLELPSLTNFGFKRQLKDDDCHNLANRDLPRARKAVREAWKESTTAFVNITSAINHLKSCVGWNIFVTIPCTIKGALEFWNSYTTYKPQLASFVTEVKNSSLTVVESFYGCARILISHSTV